MKPFLILAGIFFPLFSIASQCPNFAGKYQAIGLGTASQELSIEQNDCSVITMHYESKSSNGSARSWDDQIILDGVEREIAPHYFISYRFFVNSIQEVNRMRYSDGSSVSAFGSWSFNQDGYLTYAWETQSGGMGVRSVYRRK